MINKPYKVFKSLFAKKKNDSDTDDMNDYQQVLKCWSEILKIVDKYDYSDTEIMQNNVTISNCIEKIISMANDTPWEDRKQIIDETVEKYSYHDYYFKDMLMRLCFSICIVSDEWIYFANKVSSKNNEDSEKILLQIYYSIRDGERYLEMSHKNLTNGYEYYDLVMFYMSISDIENAVKIADNGLKKATNNLEKLVDFLFEQYEKTSNIQNMEELMRICDLRETYQYEISSKIFEYYRDAGDYENGRKYLLRSIRHSTDENLCSLYEKMQYFLNEDDWAVEGAKLLKKIYKYDILGYMNICYKNGEKEKSIEALFENLRINSGCCNEFAEKIKMEFPQKIIEYYLKTAEYYIVEVANRNGYTMAVECFKRVKDIYVNILRDQKEWKKKLSEIRISNKSRRALLENLMEID